MAPARSVKGIPIYLNSADEVPIFERRLGKYVECDRVRLANYRLVLPIGLTIESAVDKGRNEKADGQRDRHEQPHIRRGE